MPTKTKAIIMIPSMIPTSSSGEVNLTPSTPNAANVIHAKDIKKTINDREATRSMIDFRIEWFVFPFPSTSAGDDGTIKLWQLDSFR